MKGGKILGISEGFVVQGFFALVPLGSSSKKMTTNSEHFSLIQRVANKFFKKRIKKKSDTDSPF